MRYYPVETIIEQTKIFIRANIWEKNGSVDAYFQFDTGSDVIAVPKKVLIKIGASKIKDVEVKGTTGEALGELYSFNIDCGGIRLEGVEVYASETDYLIGMNFVLRGKVGFFFNGQQLIWVTQ